MMKYLRILVRLAVLLPLSGLCLTTHSAYAHQRNDVRIIRDDYGVPHIYAKDYEALWYGVGYAQAQDRLWQADLLRRTIKGSMAELFGPASLPGDIYARTLFGTRAGRLAMLEAASASTRTQFQAFAAGMNAWRQEAIAAGTLPVEYLANGLIPEPWEVSDSVAVLQLIFQQFGQNGSDELDNAIQLQGLVQAHGAEQAQQIFNDTHWLNDADAYASVPLSANQPSTQRHEHAGGRQHYIDEQEYQQQERRHQGWQHNLQRLGIKGKAASNAIAISPRLSADGHALLLGGPQMGYSVPQIALEMSLHNGALDVHGISFAGIPGISIGVTQHFAWSFTSGVSDNMDIYMDPIAQLNCHDETLTVRGAAPVTTTICETTHGPVVGMNPANGTAFSLKSAVRGYEVQSFEALQQAQYARNLRQIDRQMRRWAPNFNMLIADARGNIAYRHLGYLPIRAANDNPWLPHDGSGNSEWSGMLAWQDLPKADNPSQGWLVNWNNKPAEDWDNAGTHIASFGPVQRVDALVSQLQTLPPGTVTTDTLAAINRKAAYTNQTPSNNSIGLFSLKLLPLMLQQLDSSADPRLPSVVQRLQDWNHMQLDNDADGYYDDPAVAIFNTWFQNFAFNTFHDTLGGSLFEPTLLANLSYRLLTPSASTPLQYDYLQGAETSQLLTLSLIQAINGLSLQYASHDMQQWLQPAARLHWTQQAAIGVADSPWMNRGTYNQILHMGHGRQRYGMNVVAPGQSGNPYSPHFQDQLQLFNAMEYKPMLLQRSQQLQHQSSLTELSYAKGEQEAQHE